MRVTITNNGLFKKAIRDDGNGLVVVFPPTSTDQYDVTNEFNFTFAEQSGLQLNAVLPADLVLEASTPISAPPVVVTVDPATPVTPIVTAPVVAPPVAPVGPPTIAPAGVAGPAAWQKGLGGQS